ncbi:MAG: FAD-dependent oxidoreductase [Thermodesulfobacteriota bacterium]|nr:FAD-dependent oxidoreductase [Thermodesulfobacteriota bacterium]
MLDAAMINALVMMAVLGCVIGIGLAIASRVFYVYVDPKVEAVENALPGANCGGCGLPGCAANAAAIVAGKAAPNSCVAGGADLAETIAALLGMSIEAKEPDIAVPDCTYSVAEAKQKFVYNGISDCRAAALLSGGMKVCTVGCLGLGTCVRACPFGALSMGENGLPVVDKEKCTGCGTCERVCPKHIIKLSSVTRRILREYTTDDCIAPCRRACPAGINIPEYIRRITLGDYTASLAVIKERLPFPAVIGRICPRFCETMCRRTLVDEAVSINGLKRFVADAEKSAGRVKPFMAPSTGRQVAVIGGGVEGLSAGYFAARLGHSAMVLEASDKPGGLLRKAIAADRLPQTVLDDDIAGIREMGVTVKTRQIAGKDFTVDSLLADNFEAVLLATGGWDSRLGFDNPKALARGPVTGMALLIDVLKKEVPVRGNVVVIGGGALAAQAASACKAAGAEAVTFLLKEATGAEAGLPDDPSGVEVILNAAVERLYGTGPAVSQVEYTDLATGQPVRMAADTIVFAAGRFPELIFARRPEDTTDDDGVIKLPVQWQAVPPYKTADAAGQRGLLADGDPISDMDAAIKAINAGRKAAACMHMLMYGDPLALPENLLTPDAVVQTIDAVFGVLPKPRMIMPLRSDAEVAAGMEREAGFSEAAARTEAERCLKCGIICYQHM